MREATPESATQSNIIENYPKDQDDGTVERNANNNHPVLARMMQSLQRQRNTKSTDGTTEHSDRTPSERFIGKSSFSNSNNNNIFGRDKEMKQLLEIFERVSSSSTSGQPGEKNGNEQSTNTSANCKSTINSIFHGKSELVFVHGKSGTGKSALIQAFVKNISQQLNKQQQVFFVQGKFDQLKSHLPYAALIGACNNLAKQIIQHENSNEIINCIKSQLGPDIAMIRTTLPALSRISQDEKASFIGSGCACADDQAFARFKLLLRTFLRSVAMSLGNKAPVILFLDDLQWADAGTLEILQSMLSDVMSRHIMFIFSYRDDEINQDILQQLRPKESSSSSSSSASTGSERFRRHIVQTTDICVANLDSTSLNKMMSNVMGMDNKQTQQLSQIIHNKTGGNPYHAINFIDMLHSEGMLTQQDGEQQEGEGEGKEGGRNREPKRGNWSWDCNYILQQTDVSDNLADILEAKLLRLPEKIRSILQLASFIGYDFSTDVLTTIVHQEQDMIEGEYSFDLFEKQVIHQWIIQALDVASKEGLVEVTSGTDTYKFSHDRIQQCLYKDLMPDDVERRLLHQRIGKLLWQTIKTRDACDVDEWILFLAADNLNRGPKFVDDDVDRCEMIELNLRAAKLAQEKVAFLVAVEYFRSGEKLMKDDDGFIDSNYDVCLPFLIAAADGERNIGCFDRCNELLNQIFNHSRSLEDCFPAYTTEIRVTAEQKGLVDAIELCFKRLHLVGVKFPKPNKISLVTVMKELIRTKMAIGRMKEEDLMNLPMMKDKRKAFAMELLCAVAAYAFFAGGEVRLAFSVALLRAPYLSVRYGLSDHYAPPSFIGYGLLHTMAGKFNTGISYGNVGIFLLDKLRPEKIYGKAKIMYMMFLHAWKNGFEGLLDGLEDGYHKAMRVGEVEFAFVGHNSRLVAGLYSMGVPLRELSKEGKAKCAEMKEYGFKTQELLSRPLVQVLLNLAGDKETPNPAVLSGGAMDLDNLCQEIQGNNNDALERGMVGYGALLAYYFRDWELLEERFNVLSAMELDENEFFSAPFFSTSCTWYCFMLYKQTGMRKYKQKARAFHSKAKKFAKCGGVLTCGLQKQLKAGKALYIKKKSPKEAEDLFIDALNEMKARKMSYNPAHVSESLAESFMEVGDVEKAVHYLQMSMEINQEWGALSKVKQLKEKLRDWSSNM